MFFSILSVVYHQSTIRFNLYYIWKASIFHRFWNSSNSYFIKMADHHYLTDIPDEFAESFFKWYVGRMNEIEIE